MTSGFLQVLLYGCVAFSVAWVVWQLVVCRCGLPGNDRNGHGGADVGELEYHSQASCADFWQVPLRVLRMGATAPGMWSGRVEGVAVRMFDTLLRESSGRQGGRRQRVVLVEIPKASWPIFEIHPRGPALWLWLLLGCPGLRFRYRAGHASRDRRKIVQRFNRRYFIIIGLTRRIAELAGFDAGIPLGPSLPDEAEIRNHFCLHTLQQFSVSPGWHVECCGTHIAFWRSGSRGSSREPTQVLRQALALYRSLDTPFRDTDDPHLEVEINDLDHSQLHGRLLGLIAGALLAMGLLMLVSLPVFRMVPPEALPWVICVWPLLSLGFLAAGAYLGARWAALRDHRC